jgi:hypothetical protein
MAGPQPVERDWFIEVEPGVASVRCAYQRVGKSIVRFTVQLEIQHSGKWIPVVRYDNAHGFCHRDELHPDGTQDKSAIYVGDVNTTFTYAIQDLRSNWTAHRARFLGEMKS